MEVPGRDEKSYLHKLNTNDSLDKNHTRIYIGNLDYETKVHEVKQVFQKYGEIVSIQIRLGFAFIVIKV